MRHLPPARAAIAVVLGVLSGLLVPNPALIAADPPAQADVSAPPTETARVVGTANAFLATLDETQRAKVLYKFDDREQRARWSNFPTGFVPRGGISLQAMSEPQRAAAMALLAVVLSPKGLEKVEQIRQADEVFKTTDHGPPPGGDRDHDHGPPPFGNDRGGDHGGPPFGGGKDGPHGGPPPGGFRPGGPGGPGGAMFGRDLYFLSILGTPSEKDPWMLQFGGHHLALNITIAGDHGVLTPTLTGTQPATYTLNGKTVRPLGRENDKGFSLLNGMSEEQRKQAVLNYRVADLVLGPGHDGETIAPEGLKASEMSAEQRAKLLDLIAEWTCILNDAHSTPRLKEIKDALDDTYFAWSGPTTHEEGKNGSAYYRIQGPKLIIEYAPQHDADHVHTMYRDPTNDYGRALTAAK